MAFPSLGTEMKLKSSRDEQTYLNTGFWILIGRHIHIRQPKYCLIRRHWSFPPSEQKWGSTDKQITWPDYYSLIGRRKNHSTWIPSSDRDWLCELNTVLLLTETDYVKSIYLWLVETDHVTWILSSDWSRLFMCTEYCPPIGRDWSCELNTNIWLVETDHLTLILSSAGRDRSCAMNTEY